MQPTRKSNGASQPLFPYLAVLLVGFTPAAVTRDRRGLLHLVFTIASDCLIGRRVGCLFSVALSVGSLRPGVTGHHGSLELGLSSLHLIMKRDRFLLFLNFVTIYS